MICILVCWVVNCFRNVSDDSCYSDLTSDVIRLVNTRQMGRCSRRRKERKKTENHTKEKRQTEPNWNRRVQSHDTLERKQKEEKRERK